MARLNTKKLNSLGWEAQGRKEGRRDRAGGCSPETATATARGAENNTLKP